MKLLVTTERVYEAFKRFGLPLASIGDESVLKDILSERDLFELSYVIEDFNSFIIKYKSPLLDMVNLLENITPGFCSGSGDKCEAAPDDEQRKQWNVDLHRNNQNVGASKNEPRHPVIRDSYLIGDNCVLLVVALTKRDDGNYISSIATEQNFARSVSTELLEKMLAHFMSVKGVNEGLKNPLKRLILSRPLS